MVYQKKTESKSKWAVNIFNLWQGERQKRQNSEIDSPVCAKPLIQMSDDEMNKALSFIVAEVRNKSGNEYRPNTLYELIIAIQHYIRQEGRFVSFLDDKSFDGMRTILDSRMKDLSKKGLGLGRKQADVISEEQENYMWCNGILGADTPQKLLDSLIYQLGLHFALRAGQEHRNLRVGVNSQIIIKSDVKGTKFLEYHEDVSKTNSGGIQHRKVNPKITRAYQNTGTPNRCPVLMYEKYISLRPQNGKCDALYLRPLKNPTATVWYSDAPIGVHVLQKTVTNMCAQAGFKGNFTNHSLRATAATRLYEAGVDEQLITEKTGHRSTAVRSYKRTNDDQLKKIGSILNLNTECEPSTSKKLCVSPSSDKQESSCESGREIVINTDAIYLKLKF